METKRESGDALHTYLNDHLAGATGALRLLDRLIDEPASEEKSFYAGLRAEIDEDRATLVRLLEGAGGETSTVRQAGGWLAEKAGRLKMLLDDAGGESLGAFEELEVLGLGVLGKRGLWRALSVADLPEFKAIDFRRLETRAEGQYERIEGRRLELAREVLRVTPGAFARQSRSELE
ncbi:MAG: hypothetical protein AB7F99_16105 [Vicinamibacterales bacterium]